MTKVLFVNAPPGFLDQVSLPESLNVRTARHGLDEKGRRTELGDPRAYDCVVHICLTNAAATAGGFLAGQAQVSGRAYPANVPVVTKHFLDQAAASGGLTLFFVDHFNHETAGHPSAIRLKQAASAGGQAIRVNLKNGGVAFSEFFDRFGPSFGNSALQVLQKVPGTALAARLDGGLVAVSLEPNTIVLPVPGNIRDLPLVVQALLNETLPKVQPALAPLQFTSSALKRIEHEIADQIFQHNTKLHELHTALEREKEAVTYYSRLALLRGDQLLKFVKEALERAFGLNIVDLSRAGLIMSEGLLIQQSGAFICNAKAPGGAPDAADLAHAASTATILRNRGIELSSITVVYNEVTGNARTDATAAQRHRPELDGITRVSGIELFNLVAARREGLLNADDLARFLQFRYSPSKKAA
jgi:hypothetical protein